MASPPGSPAAAALGTLARALGLRFAAGSRIEGGTGLNLSLEASASDSRRRLAPAEPLASIATALALGVGESALLAPLDPEAFFASPDLTLLSGGGRIAGSSRATAAALGSRQGSADATAINVAIAATDLLGRGFEPLRIGTDADPFAASARASSRSLSGISTAADPPTASLRATALVRGLEGAAGNDSRERPTFRGQPAAVVLAEAQLDPETGSQLLLGSSALAQARGIAGYTIQALSSALPGAEPARVGGDARARLLLPPALSAAPAGALLEGSAIGIEASTILGPARGGLALSGRGVAELQGGAAPADLSLRGIGLSGITLIAGGGGGVSVVGMGEVLAPAPAPAGVSPSAFAGPLVDAAGIDASTILTGAGGDRVEGTSRMAGLLTDAGIRNSTVSTGAGRDTVQGTSSGSSIDTGADDDRIALQRSRDSLLVGGQGDDRIAVGAGSSANRLLGGFGSDNLLVQEGRGNRLDGGFGQDRLQASGSGNTLVQSSAGAALQAADSLAFARQLADPEFWSGLSESDRHRIWQDGWAEAAEQADALPPPPIDAITGFDPARDQLELSSALAGLTQELWMKEGGLYAANDGSLSLLEGDGSRGLGVVLGTLADIHRLGVGSPSLAYATDTRQLMFDADGDWSAGAQSLASVSFAPGTAALSKQAIRFNA